MRTGTKSEYGYKNHMNPMRKRERQRERETMHE